MFWQGAAFGAVVMLLYQLALQRHDRIMKKRAECPHRNTKLVEFMGQKTRHCEDCGWQEPIKEDK